MANLLHEALDELVAVRDELLRLTGQLSKEHQDRLDSAVNGVVDAATAPPPAKAAKEEPASEAPAEGASDASKPDENKSDESKPAEAEQK